MTETPPAAAPVPPQQFSPRQVMPRQRKSYVAGIIVDVTLAVLWLMLSMLAQANSPTGRGPGVEMFAGLVVLLCPPAVGWWLYNTTRVDTRWILWVVWSPLVLIAVGVPIAIAVTG